VPRVLGCDQSLTSFGAARASSTSEVELHRWRPGVLRGEARLQWLLDKVEEAAEGCDFIVMEGLAFGAKGSSLLDLAGLYWALRLRLWQRGIPFAVVPPSSRAKYVTGRGNASKEDCFVDTVHRFPAVDVRGNDQADALVLAAMGLDWAGCPLVAMPAAHRVALTAVVKGKPAIEWPALKVAQEVPSGS